MRKRAPSGALFFCAFDSGARYACAPVSRVRSMLHLLDNIFWHALSGPQAEFAAGSGDARRYARGFSPIVAFADARQPDFASLAPHCAAGEHFFSIAMAGRARRRGTG